MPDDFKQRADQAFANVMRAQHRLGRATIKLDEARAERDQAIIEAAEVGFARRALAQATNLTSGRVQQIVDAARERPDLQPALRMDRKRRQRSELLAEVVRQRQSP